MARYPITIVLLQGDTHGVDFTIEDILARQTKNKTGSVRLTHRKLPFPVATNDIALIEANTYGGFGDDMLQLSAFIFDPKDDAAKAAAIDEAKVRLRERAVRTLDFEQTVYEREQQVLDARKRTIANIRRDLKV